ncbi:DNA alkylation repair protein [Sagittula sp. MA-2]|jgi:3-methyladenine DNA glycosylase AlkD|uniref:DNA alkylation repair protein n=1 Tax=Sagittula sp. MA-2 TaxID=3048007 RepID=UPI0024C22AA6|nr:DNA alkylation repair protein [Sagittula sp. MA-2]WHZ33526.1 DNA alkylation repair protein [Sagittula sp. MA-2]
MTPEDALSALRAQSDPERAPGMAAYHKTDRPCLGTPNPAINDLVKDWRQDLSLPERTALADGLWKSGVFEARIAAAKLLTQARMRPSDRAAWDLMLTWVPEFDGWAIADHACSALSRRVMADLSRLDTLEGWTTSDHLWTKRSALVAALPLARLSIPKPEEIAARERVLGWAAGYTQDGAWFIQKAVGWWLRDLSKHDADRVRAFLETHSVAMKPFAVREASKYL